MKRGICGGLRPLHVLALVGLLAVGLASALPLAAPAATSVSFAPTDDTYANAEFPSATHGSESSMRVDGTPIRRAYVRFNVGSLSGTVTRATLRIYAQASQSLGYDVRSVSTQWTEATLTYNNAPAPSSLVTASSGPITAGTWKALDVTPLVPGNGTIAFALTTASQTNLPLATKESGAATAPQLVVETSASSTGTTSTSSTSAPTTTTTSTTTTTTTPPPSGSDPVIAVAGDIAGDGSGDSATAALLDSLAPTAVLTAGDNAYRDGKLSEFNAYYDPTWGRHKSRTFPTPGNHDYLTNNASGYFSYFGARAGPSGRGWYSYDLGAWHLVALNSEAAHGATSEQVAWLKNDLANTRARCVLAYWHKPRFSAGNYSDSSGYQPFWDALYAANADVVINGHDHNYQRYAPLTPTGARDDVRGIREFVVGTGGRSHYGLRADSRREAADSTSYGVLRLTLRASGYEWKFLAEAGRTYTDSGSASCH